MISENEQFIKYFNSLNLPDARLTFIEGSFDKARLKVENDNKPFIIYMHYIGKPTDYQHDRANVFLKEHLCSEFVQDVFCLRNWPIWPVDVTRPATKAELFKRMSELTQDFNSSRRSNLHRLISSQPYDSAAGLLFNQRYILDYSMNIINIERPEFKGLAGDQFLYSELLNFVDKHDKLETGFMAIRKQKLDEQEVELEKERKLRMRRMRKIKASDILKEQPDYNGDDKYIIKFRTKDQVTVKSYHPLNSVDDLLVWVEANGHMREDIQLLYSFPPRNLLEDVPIHTKLMDSSIGKKEVITIDEL